MGNILMGKDMDMARCNIMIGIFHNKDFGIMDF